MTLYDGPVGRAPSTLVGPENNCIKFFTHWVERAPDRPAIVFPSPGAPAPAGGLPSLRYDVVTFRQLDEDSRRLAASLARLGVRKGDRVLVMVPMSRVLYTTLLALFTLRACAVFLDPWVKLDQIGKAAALVRPRAFVGVPRAHWLRLLSRAVRRIRLPLVALSTRPLVHGLLLGRHVEALVEAGAAAPWPAGRCQAGDLDDPALITFTTGSTGTPKGSDRTQRFLNTQGEALARHLRRLPGDVDIPALPVFVLNNLVAGVPSVLPLVDFLRISSVDPATIVRQVRDWQVTTIGGSPSYLAPIARFCVERGLTLETVRAVVAGGAPVPPLLLDLLRRACPRARGHLEVLYGSTEVEPVASIEAEEVLGETAAGTALGQGTCVGAPVAEVDVKLCVPRAGPWQLGPGGWAEVEVAPGEVGELLVAGDHVQRRYWKNPAAEAENKVEDRDGRVWHRMGDTATRDAKGRLWLAGRVATIVERAGGRRLHPTQVEGVALAQPGVERAALVGLDGRAVLVVVPRAGVAVDADGVRRACAAAGREVDEVLVRDAVPLDPRHNAKVEYARLRAQLRGA